ncbi:MAG: hypothetical protein KAT70_02470, partial [Thermoplasmata archaeon]|nr:hypothetical protein [Thermoplasmata archaeon]
MLLGGDTKEGGGVYSATAIGVCPEGMATTRSGVKEGDLLAVTGFLGRYPALMATGRGGEALCIAPRVKEGLAGAEAGVGAAIDISDGLALSLYYLAEASGVRLEVEPGDVPVDPLIEEVEGRREELVWHSGGDFELLVAFSPSEEGKVMAAYEALGTPITVIGQAVKGEGVFRKEGKAFIPVERMGYEHFGRRGRS